MQNTLVKNPSKNKIEKETLCIRVSSPNNTLYDMRKSPWGYQNIFLIILEAFCVFKKEGGYQKLVYKKRRCK